MLNCSYVHVLQLGLAGTCGSRLYKQHALPFQGLLPIEFRCCCCFALAVNTNFLAACLSIGGGDDAFRSR